MKVTKNSATYIAPAHFIGDIELEPDAYGWFNSGLMGDNVQNYNWKRIERSRWNNRAC